MIAPGGGWVGGWFLHIIMPLRGPTCKLEPARSKQGWIPSWAECGNIKQMKEKQIKLSKRIEVLDQLISEKTRQLSDLEENIKLEEKI